MQVENTAALKLFALKHNQARKPLARWLAAAESAKWENFQQVKATFGSADMVEGNRLVFDIKGNDFRLIVKAYFSAGRLVILEVLTHADYSRKSL